MQIICQTLGGKVQSSSREFGKAEIKIKKNLLLNKMEFSKNNTSDLDGHGDEVVVLPLGFDKLAITKDNNIASIGNIKKYLWSAVSS